MKKNTLFLLLALQCAWALSADVAVSDTGGQLEPLVSAAFAQGFGLPLNLALCNALGLATKGKELPVEQLSATAGPMSRSFSVSRHLGTLDILMSRRTPTELIVMRISSEGRLVAAIRVKDGGGLERVPPESVATDFEAEKAWWLDGWLKQHAPRR